MRSSAVLTALAASTPAVMGQMNSSRPTNTSMCDYYTKALFKNNTAANQYTLLTALVNTAVIGNYSNTSMNAVTGILNNGTYNGETVSLLKYFDGMLASTNRGGDHGVSVSFLDGGGAAPLKNNKPANDTTSNQYFLLTHLYEYFGALLGCTTYGMSGFPSYAGQASMYSVHKFMDLTHNEVGYFIEQVGLAATSFGVTTDDATAVGTELGNVFNYKCLPNATVIPAQGSQAQSICVADSCPLGNGSDCSVVPYKQAVMMPSQVNDTNKYSSTSMSMAATGTGGAGSDSDSGSGSGTMSSTGSHSSPTGGAAIQGVGAIFMGAAGLAAFAAGL